MTINWWTLGIQSVNVVILIWLLGRFFWRPVAAMIEQRRASAQRILAEAEAKLSQASAALAEIERTRAGFEEERDAILAAAHDVAEKTRAARLDEVEKEAASKEAAARAAIEAEKAASNEAWGERASHLAIEIAERLMIRLDGSAVRAAFLGWLLDKIRNLPEPARQAVTANGAALEAISATPLDPADEERYRTLIGEALGGHPRIVFKADPALIAGLELHAPNLVVSNSWRADLSQILVKVMHDNRR